MGKLGYYNMQNHVADRAKFVFHCPFLIHLPINYDSKREELDRLAQIRLGIKVAYMYNVKGVRK